MDSQEKASLALEVYEKVYQQINNDRRLRWVADQIVAGTLTSVKQINGTPVITLNLNTGQFIWSDGTTRRMLIGFGPGLF